MDLIKEKPIQNYKCIKKKLDTILNRIDEPLPPFLKEKVEKDKTFQKINEAVLRGSRITQKTYFLLRLWVLKKYEEKIEIPDITPSLIGIAMCSILKNKSESKFSDKNLLLYQEFKKLHNFALEDGMYLRVPLDYYSIQMVTAIENNVKNNFIHFLNRFVNSYFKKKHETEIEDKKFKKTLMDELRLVKNDILNGTKLSHDKYHEWIDTHLNGILPSTFNKNIHYDIKTRPQRYLKHMIYMNIELEKIDAKLFQFFPLQTSTVPVHFNFDTTAINELLYKKIQKKEKNDDEDKNNNMTEEKKKKIWHTFFNIKMNDNDDKKNYKFDYTIITDGYSVSIRYVEKEKYKQNQIKEQKKLEGRNKTKGISVKDKSKNASLKKEEKEEKNQKLIQEGEKEYEDNKEGSVKKSEYKHFCKERKDLETKIEKLKQKKFKTKSAISKNLNLIEKFEKELEEMKEIIHKLNFKKEEQEKLPFKKKGKTSEEFPYIDDVDKKNLEGTHIFIDPGKRSLLTMMNDEGKYLSYTNRRWLNETSRLKYRKRIEKRKLEHDTKEKDESNHILKKEKELSKLKSKSCNTTQFDLFIEKKLEGNTTFYINPVFRRYKWYAYINKLRATSKMLNLIEDTYNRDRDKKLKIIIGDWSIGKQMRHFISTPNISIKRKLKERFHHVYNIDEFKTSCIHHKMKSRCDNLYLNIEDKKDPTKKENRKMHSILTYQMENKRLGCINRDKNSCKNIQTIFDSFMKTGERPAIFRREKNQTNLLLT